MLGVDISNLDKLELPDDLRVDQPQVVINCLIEHPMENVQIDLLANGPDSLDPIHINELKELLYFLGFVLVHLLGESSQEFYNFGVVVVDAKVKAVEQREGVLLDVVRVVANDLNDF